MKTKTSIIKLVMEECIRKGIVVSATQMLMRHKKK